MEGRITSITEVSGGRVLSIFVPKGIQPQAHDNTSESTEAERRINEDVWANYHFREKCYNELCVGNIDFNYRKGKF